MRVLFRLRYGVCVSALYLQHSFERRLPYVVIIGRYRRVGREVETEWL